MIKNFGILCILCFSLVLTGCGSLRAAGDNSRIQSAGEAQDTGEHSDASAQEAIRAVYLENANGFLFVNIEQDSPFTGTIPEDMEDEDGNRISEEDLSNGDVLDVYGNGIMLESYPGQYPGITKLVRVEKENREYVQKYQELIAQLLPEPDRSQPPVLALSYSQTDALVTAVCDQFGYTWEFTDENGESQVAAVDSVHVLQSEGLTVMNLEGETQMKVEAEYLPEQMTVLRWQTSLRDESWENIPGGEAVEMQETEDGCTFLAEPGYIYELTGIWPEGEVLYGFEAAAR